ncbi:hypothetical protein Q5692_08305 [Microcoleus sp. C2C3]|uniref:hypothetical protein n=1 Tax=unclassified Microcoleus TaxID=2642155 RepID=UPI002FD3442E
MKYKRSNIRLTKKRYNQLLLLSAQSDRTISSLVDEWIDSLPEPQKEKFTAGFTLRSGFHPWAEATGMKAYFLIKKAVSFATHNCQLAITNYQFPITDY